MNSSFNIGKFLLTSLVVVFRSLIVGGLTSVLLIFNVDFFTNSSYGVMTLVIIISCFVFFISFFVLCVEFFFWELRKSRRNKKNNE